MRPELLHCLRRTRKWRASVEVLGNGISILNFCVKWNNLGAKFIGQLLLNKGDKVKLFSRKGKVMFIYETQMNAGKVVAEEELKVCENDG